MSNGRENAAAVKPAMAAELSFTGNPGLLGSVSPNTCRRASKEDRGTWLGGSGVGGAVREEKATVLSKPRPAKNQKLDGWSW